MESPRPQTKPITTPEKKKIPLGNHIAQHAIRANQGQQAFLQSRRVVLKQAGEILKRQIEIAKNVVDIQGNREEEKNKKPEGKGIRAYRYTTLRKFVNLPKVTLWRVLAPITPSTKIDVFHACRMGNC